jgi:NAD+ synthase (glutamine-hydrolysing)
MIEQVRNLGLPLLFTHMVGGQDEVVFDGGSFALDARARIAARSPIYEEALDIVAVSADGTVIGNLVAKSGPDAQVWGALVTGVRDYVGKNGFEGVVIGLSGGIDSALVLAIAVDALGPAGVRTVMMPSAYTADMSREDAREMALRLGVQHDEMPIAHLFDDFRRSLAVEFAGLSEDATEENIQARIRATLLMAISNKTGCMLLSTGNKSELATGYCTLYGDMAGGFAAIKDLSKTWVYRLAKWKNAQGAEVIPLRIIERPPSAELRPGQTDQDSLPDYAVIDAIVERYIEEDESVDQIVAAGLPRADVERVRQLIKANEYKRRQAPIGTRITHRAFGRDWRYPITSKFRA